MGAHAPGRLMAGRPMRGALVAGLLALVPSLAAAALTIDAMRGHRRVLLVASPVSDPRLAQQRRVVAQWRRGARDRDVSLVEVSGDRVRGSADSAKLLRHQWRLPPGEFQAVLIGKDGHEVLRERHPLAARALQRTIDAMPMRRAGQR
jgi:hypothetical protein